MEETANITQDTFDQMYQYACNLFMAGKNVFEVKAALMSRGLDAGNAEYIANMLEQQVIDAKKEKAKKDMLYGALWCGGGLVLTLAHIGFIFWGAILFGAIQFFRGVSNIN
jgi:fructosamine-3-kinase